MRCCKKSLEKSEFDIDEIRFRGKMPSMKTIDLTNSAAAIAYLATLPAAQQISLPGAGEATTEGDAVTAVTGLHANEWANSRRRWDWAAGELVAALREEARSAFITAFAGRLEMDEAEAEAQWAGFANQLSDGEIGAIEAGGADAGVVEAGRFLELYPA